jgi:6-phosphofructokinase 1
MSAEKGLGILVGGGPAPGINAVIGAATIKAITHGFGVIGFYDGWKWLSSSEFDSSRHSMPLTIEQVARIHFNGGSILRVSRANLFDERQLETSITIAPDADKVQRAIEHLNELGITHLITIGGDDTAGSARFICEASDRRIKVVHVPKTIDNDLPLPHGESTFGYATARYWGAQAVKSLMQDSMTTGRWYLITTMGRKAGWLALGIGASSGCTLTLIAEEFEEHTTLGRIADVLEGAVLKRRVMGRRDGVALMAEGLAYRLGDRGELERLLGKKVSLDAAGHLRLAQVPLAEWVKTELEQRFANRGEKIDIVTHQLGYELRSMDPIPEDVAYCRTLGNGSIRLLVKDDVPSGVMVTVVDGNIQPMRFEEMVDPQTNRMSVRLVDTRSDSYRVAREYMIRLERSDFDNSEMLEKLALEALMAPDQFRERFLRAATVLVDMGPAGVPPSCESCE